MKLLFALPLLLAATIAVEAQTPSWLPPADSARAARPNGAPATSAAPAIT